METMQLLQTGGGGASPSLTRLLPEPLRAYLFGLATLQPLVEQEFLLIPGVLGGKAVQDILHLDPVEKTEKRHRVFGIVPVECLVRVTPRGGALYMDLPLENL